MIKVIAFDFAGVIVESPLKNWFEKHVNDDAKEEMYRDVTTR